MASFQRKLLQYFNDNVGRFHFRESPSSNFNGTHAVAVTVVLITTKQLNCLVYQIWYIHVDIYSRKMHV